jgi:hypothetical protein
MAKKFKVPEIYEKQQNARKAELAKHSNIAELKKRRIVAVIPAQPGYALTVAAVVSSNWSDTEMCFGKGKVIAWGFDELGKAHALTDNGIEEWYVNNGCFYRSIVTTEDGWGLHTHGNNSLDQWKRNTVSQCEHDLGTGIFVHPGEDYPHEPGCAGFEYDGKDIADEFTAKRTEVRKALDLVATSVKPDGRRIALGILTKLSEYGQLRLSQLKPEKLKAVLAACDRALADYRQKPTVETDESEDEFA